MTTYQPEPCETCDAPKPLAVAPRPYCPDCDHGRATECLVHDQSLTVAAYSVEPAPCELHNPVQWGDSWLHPSERKFAPPIDSH